MTLQRSSSGHIASLPRAPARVAEATTECTAPATTAGTTRTRSVALDTVRGAMLVMMAANHIPSDLQLLTNHPLGYVSAAEGFVFLAGLLCGAVYTRRYVNEGPAAATKAALLRAGTVYGTHLLCLALVVAWVCVYQAFAAGSPPGSPVLAHGRPLAALAAGALLVYQPGLLDILPLYCGFMLLLPLVLWQLQQGRTERVLGLSFAWWVFTNLFDAQQPYVRGLVNTGAFNFGAWQLLFVAGVVFGHGWAHGRTLLPSPSRIVLILAGTVALLLAISRHALPHLGGRPEWLDWLTNKNNLAPVRFIDIALLFYLVALAIRRWPRAFSSAPLAYLGRQSLAVFSVHVVGATIILGFPDLFEVSAAGRSLATVLLGCAMFGAAFLAHRRDRLRVPA
jgi:hypothetical protein